VAIALGEEFSERAGSRFAVLLFDEDKDFHRPHTSPDTPKGDVASIQKYIEEHGLKP